MGSPSLIRRSDQAALYGRGHRIDRPLNLVSTVFRSLSERWRRRRIGQSIWFPWMIREVFMKRFLVAAAMLAAAVGSASPRTAGGRCSTARPSTAGRSATARRPTPSRTAPSSADGRGLAQQLPLHEGEVRRLHPRVRGLARHRRSTAACRSAASPTRRSRTAACTATRSRSTRRTARWTGGIYDEARRGWLHTLEGQDAAQQGASSGRVEHVPRRGDRPLDPHLGQRRRRAPTSSMT